VRRLQAVVALVVVAVALAGAAYAERELPPRSPGAATALERVPSGAWYCPHGGGEDWEVSIRIANPGPSPATVRVRSLGSDKPAAPQTMTVDAGATVAVPVAADARERATMVEWFDRWVAVGWVSHAGGDEGGVAAEPCSPAAGRRWLLPDGSTATKEQDDQVIVMNPTARDAVVSFTLLSERRVPVQKSELTDVVIKPFHSISVGLSEKVAGEETVSTIVDAAAGRVVAGTLGISTNDGIRSTLGYLGRQPAQVVFPGGADAGRSQLAVMSTGTERARLGAEMLGSGQPQPFPGVADAAPPASSARTFTTTTAEPTSVTFASADPGVAAVRRTFGSVSDQGATIGGAPAGAWVVLPSVFGTPNHPGLVLANPGEEPAEVTLSVLGSTTTSAVTVPPHASLLAPKRFVEARPGAAVVAVASSGTFVPAAVSYSRGREGFATYAVARGLPIPSAWVPS
jgi:hypothetical protein